MAAPVALNLFQQLWYCPAQNEELELNMSAHTGERSVLVIRLCIYCMWCPVAAILQRSVDAFVDCHLQELYIIPTNEPLTKHEPYAGLSKILFSRFHFHIVPISTRPSRIPCGYRRSPGRVTDHFVLRTTFAFELSFSGG